MAADALQLDILRELREAAGLTQDDMARLCGLQGQMRRQTAGAWERGDIIPTRTRRHKVIGYLWDHLHLRRDPARFEAVWEILMREWGWEPISDQEWTSFTQIARPARNDEVEEKLAVLSATLHHLQSHANAPATSQPPPSPEVQLPLGALPLPSPLPTGSRMPLGRNSLFVGREGALLALAAAFGTGNTTAISQVETAAATGMGGIGKTQLASEFVHRYGQFFSGGVFWLSFDNTEAISSEFAACGGADTLDLRPDFATRPLEEQVRLVQAAFQTATPRLLVFDNCEDPALIVRWRPTSGGCRVLVTSRSLEWDLSLGVQVHALDVLSREESLQLLQKHKLNTSPDVLEAIATELGDLPLALHLAGSYLHRYRRALTAEQYLAFLRDPALLDHPSLQGSGPSPTGHVQHVARTFALSFDRLDPEYQLDARARQILVHMALLAPGEPVAYDLLAETLDTDLTDPHQAVKMEEAIMRLLELGLIDVHGEQQLWIHRLVASFLHVGARELWDVAQSRVEATIQRKLDDYFQLIQPLPLLPIQTHLRHVTEVALQREDAFGVTLSHALTRYLWGIGDIGAACQVAERGLLLSEAIHGPSHMHCATSHHLLGILRQEAGQFDAAHHHLQIALDLHVQRVGEFHFDTVNTLVNIAELYWTEQQLQPALATLERALRICDAAVEEDAPVVAEVTMALGLCLFENGHDPQQALYFLHEALRIRRQALGDEHPYTAYVLTSIGYVHQQSGALAEADDYYQQGLAIRQRLLGEEHPDTAHSLYSLGKLRRRQGEWDAAEGFLRQALSIYLENQGEEYIFAASCLNELGAAALGKGDLATAHQVLKRALAVRQKLFQTDHPHIADTLYHLGMTWLTARNLVAAAEHLQQSLQIRQRVAHGDNIWKNLDVAESLCALGDVAAIGNDRQRAQDYYTQCLALYLRCLGDDHPLTSQIRSRVAQLAVQNTPA